MPILDLGYRPWNGPRTPLPARWTNVASSGISLVWRALWLRRILMVSWIPGILTVVVFFIYEQSRTSPDGRMVVGKILGDVLRQRSLGMAVQADPMEVRHAVWAHLLLAYFRYPQATAMVILLGLVAPRLISFDLRSRAYLLYFSRPLRPEEYILGKAAVLFALLAAVTTVPALAIYGIGLLIAPDLSVFWDTWDLPLRVMLASLILAIPTSAIALCYSSFTTESRYASFAWFTTWIMGWISYGVVSSRFMFRDHHDRYREMLTSQWYLVSPYHTLGKLQTGAFGVLREGEVIWPAVLLTSLITVGCLLVTYQRISLQLRQ